MNIVAPTLGTIVGMRLYGNAGVAIATGVLTFVILVFAEVMPKTIAASIRSRSPFRAVFCCVRWQNLSAAGLGI